MINNIIIGNVIYKVHSVKNNDSIKITVTHSIKKYAYSAVLDEKKINQIVSNTSLICNMTKFYELFLSSFKNNPKISISGKLNDNQIILTMSVKLIDDLSYTVDYTIVLEKIPKSDIVRLEEMMMDMHQIKQKLLNKKWIDVKSDDNDYVLKQEKIKQSHYQVIIPNHIVQKASKVKLLFKISRQDYYNKYQCMAWTKHDTVLNERHTKDCFSKDPRFMEEYENQGYYILTTTKKVDIDNDNNTIFIEHNDNNYTYVEVFLIAYKQK